MLVIYRVLQTLPCREREVTVTWNNYLEEERHVAKDHVYDRRH